MLAGHPPAGFVRSASFAVSGAPWAPREQVYEDWYAIEDFAALGRLNEWAVSGAMKQPHDDAAARSAWGTGAIYKLLSGDALANAAFCGWRKQRPESVEGTLWQRQLALGPAPEFCVHAPQGIQADFAAALRQIQ
jgi:hypothetical protein